MSPIAASPTVPLPLPPADPGLPTLATALDEAAMTERLQSELATQPIDLDVLSCRPVYIRLKLGTSSIVLYQVTLRQTGAPAGTASWVTSAHARLGRPGGVDRVLARRSFQRLVARAARRHPGPPQPRVVSLQSLDALLQFYPLDRDLPALVRAAEPGKAARLLGATLDHGAHRLALRSVDLVRYRPGRKALLRYQPVDRARDAIYLKVYADDRAARVRALGLRLLGAGVTVPRPLRLVDQIDGCAQVEVHGTRLAELDGTALMARLPDVGEALARLHAVRIDPADRLPSAPVSEASRVAVAARTIAQLCPELTAGVGRLAARLLPALEEAGTAGTLIHGDFYDDQVLVGRDGAVLLDLDEARRGDPHVDLGNALAHLAARGADRQAAEVQAAALLDGYGRGGRIDRRRLPLYAASAALQMAVGPFRRLEPDWPAGVERLVTLAGERLAAWDGGQQGRPEATTPVAAPRRAASGGAPARTLHDPALPTLARLCDPEGLAPAFSRAMKGPVHVSAVTVVRHKPGRRCTLRYDLQQGDQARRSRSRLYGKTYASDRGPAVHAALVALAGGAMPPGSPTVPRPVAWLPDLRLHLLSSVPGTPVEPFLRAGDCATAERLADAVCNLHASRSAIARSHDLTAELAPLTERVEQLRAASPRLRSAATRCLAAVLEGARRPWPWRYRPIHRDLYHDQILIGPHGVSFVDLDDAALGEPAVDVANVVAHLRLLAIQSGAERPLSDVGRAFRARCLAIDPGLDPELVRLLEGATLLRLAAIHLPRASGEVTAGALLAAAGALLEVPGAVPCA